jgi:hypothetical protein
MRRSLVALAVVSMLLLTASAPASAGSWFQFRINPSRGDWTCVATPCFSDLPYTFNTTMIGARAFIQPGAMPVGLRLNLDSGSLGSWSPLTFYDGGHWRYYEIALGIPLTLGSASVLLYAGYGNHAWRASFGGTTISTQDASGLVYGADIMARLMGPWYVTASGTFGSGLNYKYANPPGLDPRSLGTASTSVYGAAVGYMLPNSNFNIELGWRSGGFRVTSITSGDTSASNQDTRWNGWFLGVSTRR